MHTDVWNTSMLLLVLGIALTDLIYASQTSLTTTESPTQSFRVVQDKKNRPYGPCSRNRQCCKLGRKAARKSNTCRFEVLIKSLEYQIASLQRLNPAAGRLQAVLSYPKQARTLRRRMRHCQEPLDRRCFQHCCRGMNLKLSRPTPAHPRNSSQSTRRT